MYHVTSRSIAEEHVFRELDDFKHGIRILGDVVHDGLCVCHMFCFMPTHWHALVTVDDGALADAVHRVNRRYASAFNRRYSRRGKVFDTPYSATEVTTESYFLSVVRYIALNPPEPETWPFSSYPGLIGKRRPFAFVEPKPILDAFGSVDRLRRFVDAGRRKYGT